MAKIPQRVVVHVTLGLALAWVYKTLQYQSAVSARWDLEGVAESPSHKPQIKDRVSGGIGQTGRFDYDPASRNKKQIGLDLPPFIQPPRPGFPLLVRPRTQRTLREHGQSARLLVDSKLSHSEAMLFHGLPIRNANDFSTFMQGMDYPPVTSHGASERPTVAPLVYAASDDVPADFTLHPHNEQAYLAHDEVPSYPRKIFFCCLQEPTDDGGGETPIVSNKEITEGIHPKVLEKFRQYGVGYESNHSWGDLDAPIELNLGGKQSWQKRFNTSDARIAEREAQTQGYDLLWEAEDPVVDSAVGCRVSNETGKQPQKCKMQLRWSLPAFKQSGLPSVGKALGFGSHSFLGKEWWWNQASNVFSFTPTFGDAARTQVSEEELEHLNAVLWEKAVAFRWRTGDVLVVDNERAMHARTSFTSPRKIVTSFSAT